jgi:uncharacterized protein (DUF433 family)
MSTVTQSHIDIDEKGVARFSGTRFKIIHVIIDHVAWKWSPEAIQLQHPDLTMAQIHSALAYYYDYRQEFDEQIQQSHGEYERLRAENQDSPIRKKLLENRKQRQS